MTGRFPAMSVPQDAHGRAIAADAHVGADVHLGNNVTIYPRVHIGDGCDIMDGAVLGRVPLPNETATRPVDVTFSDLTLGAESIVGCNAVLYTGSAFGRNVLVGDLASIREGCVVGDGVIIGRGVMLLYDCTVGPFSRIQDQAHLVGNIVIEEHVFIGMGVMTTNDDDVFLSRFGLTTARFRAPVIRRFAVVGAGSTVLRGAEIGEGAMVAAGAVVTRDVPPWTVVAGVPARHVRHIPDDWRRQIESLHGIERP